MLVRPDRASLLLVLLKSDPNSKLGSEVAIGCIGLPLSLRVNQDSD